MTAAARWRRLDLPGTDEAHLLAVADGYTLAGLARFREETGPVSLSYLVDIDEDWLCTAIGDRFGRRHERTRHRYNLIAGADTAGKQRQPDGLRSAPQPNRVVAFAKGSESFLKIGDRGSASKNSTVDHVSDGAFEMTPERSVMGFKI